MGNKPFLSLLLLFTMLSAARGGAQSKSPETETLVKSKIQSGFVFAVDDKLSTIEGDFANFAGFHSGWIVNHKLLIGFAVYGSTSGPPGVEMAYGGLQLEYFLNPNKLFNYSLRALMGGGELESRGRRGDYPDPTGFFVFEPEARVTLNVLRAFRVGFGLGYRFADAHPSPLNPGGTTFSFSIKFGKF